MYLDKGEKGGLNVDGKRWECPCEQTETGSIVPQTDGVRHAGSWLSVE